MKLTKRDKIKEALFYYRYLMILKTRAFKGDIISIFGMPRGGTTWLSELIRTIPNSTLVWEPLFMYRQYKINFINPFSYPEQRKYGLSWNMYLPPDIEDQKMKIFFSKLFSRKIINLKLYRFNSIKEIGKSNTLIFKFCFGNLLLPWLVHNFKIKPILLIRHPCAVISSQLSFGNNFQWHKENYKLIKDRVHQYPEIFKQYLDVVQYIKSPEALLAFEWAVQYNYLIKHPWNNKEWLTVSYEDLYINGQVQINRIFEYLKRDVPSGIYKMLRTPSFSSSSGHSKKEIQTGNQIIAWRDRLTKEQISNIFSMLEIMNVDYYSLNPEPDYNIIYNNGKC